MTRPIWRRVHAPVQLLAVHPGTRAYQCDLTDGHLSVFVGREMTDLAGGDRVPLWHLSISHRTSGPDPRPGRYPTWDEIREARERLGALGMVGALLARMAVTP